MPSGVGGGSEESPSGFVGWCSLGCLKFQLPAHQISLNSFPLHCFWSPSICLTPSCSSWCCSGKRTGWQAANILNCACAWTDSSKLLIPVLFHQSSLTIVFDLVAVCHLLFGEHILYVCVICVQCWWTSVSITECGWWCFCPSSAIWHTQLLSPEYRSRWVSLYLCLFSFHSVSHPVCLSLYLRLPFCLCHFLSVCLSVSFFFDWITEGLIVPVLLTFSCTVRQKIVQLCSELYGQISL